MAKKKVTKEFPLLSPESTTEEAMEQLMEGHITKDQYVEWDHARVALATTKGQKKGKARKKTECPLDYGQFMKDAKPITLDIGGQEIDLEPRQFSSGSFGYGFSGKVQTKVGKVAVKLQCSLNMTVVGSKPQ